MCCSVGTLLQDAKIIPLERANKNKNCQLNLHFLRLMISNPVAAPTIGTMKSGETRSRSIIALPLWGSLLIFVLFRSIPDPLSLKPNVYL